MAKKKEIENIGDAILEGETNMEEYNNTDSLLSGDETLELPAADEISDNNLFTPETAEPEQAEQPFRELRKLTIENNYDANTSISPEDISWHEVQSAYRTRRILTGQLSGIERMENGNNIAVVYYKEIRIVIPVSEMMIELSANTRQGFGDMETRQSKIINNMLGCDIDFIVRGIDRSSRSAVASRKEAMQRKRQTFYFTPDSTGLPGVHEGRIVQARVIAVAEKVIRIEVFGVECAVPARELTWDWCGDAREKFHVGDEIDVKVTHVDISDFVDEDGKAQKSITVAASAKQATNNIVLVNLRKCKIQGKYVGTVTDVTNGGVYIRLSNGVNAIAHTCNDPRMPGKKDNVSFVVTRIDEEREVAFGLITRIIRQNI